MTHEFFYNLLLSEIVKNNGKLVLLFIDGRKNNI